MPEYTLHSRGENWFHFRIDPTSAAQSFSVTYCHDGTVCMTGDMGCLVWQRDYFPKKLDYGFPYERIGIGYFAEKIVRAEESQVIRAWDRDAAIADIEQALLEDRGTQDNEVLEYAHAQMCDHGSGYREMLAAFDGMHTIEGEEYCEFGWDYSPIFKKRFDMLRSVSRIILDAVKDSMNTRTELDPVDQDRPLGDLGVSKDVEEVNKNDK